MCTYSCLFALYIWFVLLIVVMFVRLQFVCGFSVRLFVAIFFDSGWCFDGDGCFAFDCDLLIVLDFRFRVLTLVALCFDFVLLFFVCFGGFAFGLLCIVCVL